MELNGRLGRLEEAMGGRFDACPRCDYPSPPPEPTQWERLEQIVTSLAASALAEGRSLVIGGREVLPELRPKAGWTRARLSDRVAGSWQWQPVLRRALEAAEPDRAHDAELDETERLRAYLAGGS